MDSKCHAGAKKYSYFGINYWCQVRGHYARQRSGLSTQVGSKFVVPAIYGKKNSNLKWVSHP